MVGRTTGEREARHNRIHTFAGMEVKGATILFTINRHSPRTVLSLDHNGPTTKIQFLVLYYLSVHITFMLRCNFDFPSAPAVLILRPAV